MPARQLCIVVPTFNESENIVPLLDRLQRVLQQIPYEVIVVDDDSADGTAAVVRRIAATQENIRVLHRIGRRGLASACIEGMLATSAPYIAVMDADLQHDESLLPEMYRRITAEGLDLVVGSRNVSGGSMGEFTPWRVRLSRAGRRLSGLGGDHALSDPMSGFFMLRRAFFERIAHRLSGVGFKILLDIVLSADAPIRMAELPYTFRLREHGESKLDVMVGLEYLELLIDKLIGNYVSVRFVLFGSVGALGVGIHLLLLWGLLSLHRLSFSVSQGVATGIVMMLNYSLNNYLTYRDRRRHGWQFWTGMILFCVACSLGLAANVAVSRHLYQMGVPWILAGITGLAFSGVWNFGVTSIAVWRRRRRSVLRRAERRLAAADLIEGRG